MCFFGTGQDRNCQQFPHPFWEELHIAKKNHHKNFQVYSVYLGFMCMWHVKSLVHGGVKRGQLHVVKTMCVLETEPGTSVRAGITSNWGISLPPGNTINSSPWKQSSCLSLRQSPPSSLGLPSNALVVWTDYCPVVRLWKIQETELPWQRNTCLNFMQSQTKSYFYHVNRAIKLPKENTTRNVNSRLFGWDTAPNDGMFAWLAVPTPHTPSKKRRMPAIPAFLGWGQEPNFVRIPG